MRPFSMVHAYGVARTCGIEFSKVFLFPTVQSRECMTEEKKMTPIVTQVLVKKKTLQALRRIPSARTHDNEEPTLYSKDVADFVIFAAVVFMVVMIALYA